MTDWMLNRRSLLQGAAALGGAGALGLAHAQDPSWPGKLVRLVVPYNAGGATDLMARTVAEALSERLGRNFIVENRGGAGGILGTSTVAKAKPDGQTLLLSLSTSMLINQFLYSKLPYKPLEDLAMITQVAAAPVTLVVNPSVPANNMQELLQYVRENKSKLAYGSWGVGSYAHLGGAYMSKSMDADMVHVAYPGEAPMLQELIGGGIQLSFASALGTKPFIDSGRLKVIGVTGRERMQILPDVPSIYAQGVTDDAYAVVGWVGMAAPAGMAPELVEQMVGHMQEIGKLPQVLERIASAGFMPVMNTPAEFLENYQRDMPIWQTLVEEAGAQLD